MAVHVVLAHKLPAVASDVAHCFGAGRRAFPTNQAFDFTLPLLQITRVFSVCKEDPVATQLDSGFLALHAVTTL